jgi:hypothetical protein
VPAGHPFSDELVAGDPDVGSRRGVDVHEGGALAGRQRREHVAVPRLVDSPHRSVELGDADVELLDRLAGGLVGHRYCVPVVGLAPLRPRRRRVLLDVDGRGMFGFGCCNDCCSSLDQNSR